MRNEYWINIRHVDNRLVVFLNGETAWDSGIVHDDPSMDVWVEITGSLESHSGHTSELIFEGFNDSYNNNGSEFNPWHFSYRVIKKTFSDDGQVTEEDMLVPYNEKHLSDPNIKAINNVYHFVKKNDIFKVVSNNLSQQFYK
ncbi:MAG TPA: hypothetical protein PLZ10_02610 [Chitinophagaceae bacterium]|jgi:hypothetical protein|nr:hypothetical protein [Chitinophagaceae bacterium]